MARVLSGLMVVIAVVLAVVGGRAISAQDKYTVQVSNGLAFSEFRGYEDWPVIAISENEGLIAAIVGNPVMIDAYKEGVPGNGKPFPDGAKMVHETKKGYTGKPLLGGFRLTGLVGSCRSDDQAAKYEDNSERSPHAGPVKSWLGHFDLVRANRSREPRMSSQIPTGVRTNRMTTLSQ